MIDNTLLSRDALGFDEYAITPKPNHLIPDSIERERVREQLRTELTTDPDAVIITHTDADGFSSAALLVEAIGSNTVVQPIDYAGGYRFEHVLDDLEAVVSNIPIYICDFNPGSRACVSQLERLIGELDCQITWYDHHQWDDGLVTTVQSAGVDVVIDEDECATSLIEHDHPYEFAPHLRDLAICTKDIDLWIREDKRSDRLNVFASLAEPWEYIETVLEYGADLPSRVERRIDDCLERERELEQAAIDNRFSTRVGDCTVAMTYSRGGRSASIGNELVEDHPDDYDIAIVMQTHGAMGIYSRSDRETFASCHEIASQLGGGGHPTAAGSKVPVETFRDLAAYWATAGTSVRSKVTSAIETVVHSEEGSNET